MMPNTRVSPDWRSRQIKVLGRLGELLDKISPQIYIAETITIKGLQP
ncbi:hypothetical protein [Nostoc punctiforme]|nr:hypothetical protein [Nostoc punctiforme]